MNAAATAAPTRISRPAMLIGLLIFAAGVALREPWMGFLGVALFLAAHMSAGAASLALPGLTLPGLVLSSLRRRGAASDSPDQTASFAPTCEPEPAVPLAQDSANSAAARAYANATSCAALRLRPIVPLHHGVELHSWFGGRPYMPSETDWPVLNGEPALFIAQISCAHIPSDIWAGRGPRFGWLVVFMSQSRHGSIKLIHINRFGHERTPPGPLKYPRNTVSRVDILDLATGRGGEIPRWPVEFTRPGPADASRYERTAKTGGDDSPAARLLRDFAFDDPRFQPFDWGSAMVLIEVIVNDLGWQHKVVSALAESGAEDPRSRAFLETLAHTLGQVEALMAELLTARDSGLPFDDRLRDLILRGLGRLQVDSVAQNGLSAKPAMLSLLDHDQIRRDYFRWFDHYAKLVYCDAPSDLPDAPRKMFEELWAWHALHERGWIGGPLPRGFRTACKLEDDTGAPAEPLLRLQSSDLMGWTFGDQDELGVFIDATALAGCDFREAFGEVSD